MELPAIPYIETDFLDRNNETAIVINSFYISYVYNTEIKTK